MLDDALAVLDHVAMRVTASTITGLGCGAAYSTLKGYPIFKTSVSTAVSFALVSTACFGMERVASIILKQSSAIIYNDSDEVKRIESTGSIIDSPINPKLIYGSHFLGGLMGGSVVGGLFQGKPLAGAFLLAPIMLGIGKIEVSLDEYKSERLQQLVDMDNTQQSDDNESNESI